MLRPTIETKHYITTSQSEKVDSHHKELNIGRNQKVWLKIASYREWNSSRCKTFMLWAQHISG